MADNYEMAVESQQLLKNGQSNTLNTVKTLFKYRENTLINYKPFI
jgi:hypothetical protein